MLGMMLEATNVSACRTSIFAKNTSICYNLPYHYIAVSFGTNMIFGLPANCYVLWLSMNEMIRRQSTEIFVFNTALVEVIFSFSFVLVFQYYFFHCMHCKEPTIFLGVLLLIGRPLFQCCICMERYLGVLHPLTFLKLKHIKYRIACSAVGWITIICSCLTITTNVFEIYTFFLPHYVVFLTIKLYTCSRVLTALLRPGPGEDVKQRDAVNRDKIKAFRIMQMVLASSMFTYIPIVISLLLYHFIDFERFLLSWSVSLCIGIMMGFVQPFLYLRRVGKLHPCFRVLKNCAYIRGENVT